MKGSHLSRYRVGGHTLTPHCAVAIKKLHLYCVHTVVFAGPFLVCRDMGGGDSVLGSKRNEVWGPDAIHEVLGATGRQRAKEWKQLNQRNGTGSSGGNSVCRPTGWVDGLRGAGV